MMRFETCRGYFVAAAFLALPTLGQAQRKSPALPQLGKASLPEVVAALTPEEKIHLVMGLGVTIQGLPAGILPTADPDVASLPERVPGAGGRTYPVARLGIPSVTLSDGPAGIHIDARRPNDPHTYYATAFPTAALLASSWDADLLRRVGTAFGTEARSFGIDVLLVPAMNIQRNPLGGRNFEYYSEDPVVSGRLAGALVGGIQAQGVGATLKHFAANNQEFNRMKLNTVVSERALRELYLRGFELAIAQAQPWTIMSSYNLINGTPTSESQDLLTGILRQEWGFKGLVMSDWHSDQSPVAQLQAGNDLIQPGFLAQRLALNVALKSGQLTTAQLDANVTRVLELVLKTPTFKHLPYDNRPNLKASATVAREASAESMVLLRNQAQTLPLAAGRQVALFGNTSYDLLVGGTGSGNVNRAYTVSFAQGLAGAGFRPSAPLGQAYADYLKAEQAKLPPSAQSALSPPAPFAEMPVRAALLQQQAQTSDVAIITLGRSTGEGVDRQVDGQFTLTAAEQALLQQVATAFHAQGKKLVVVLNVGGVMEVASWRDQADAILLAGLPGQEAGHALADVLSGKVNPSGKLAATYPMSYADVPYAQDFPGKVRPGSAPPAMPIPIFFSQEADVTYAEGIFVGYRYYNTFNVKPAYEFGYGLSYSTFAYGPLRLSSPTLQGSLTATVTVTNSGPVAGKEVVQLYVSAPAGALAKPESELKAFAKTKLLAPGQSQTLTFQLTAADLASFDPATAAWVTPAGTYTLKAAASSRLTQQTATVQVPARVVTQQTHHLLVPQTPVAELQVKK